MSMKQVVSVVLLALLGYEIVREAVVLKHMGFQPDRFIEWLKG